MYIYPNLGGINLYFLRLFGPGLGNSLLIWSKAKVYSNIYNLKFIEPSWNNLKLRNIFDFNYRNYSKYFINKNFSFQQIRIIYETKKISEEYFFKNKLNGKKDYKKLLIIDNHNTFFEPLKNHRQFVKDSIMENLNKNFNSFENQNYKNVVGMHVRRNDFVKTRDQDSTQTDIDWFIKIKNKLDEIFDRSLKFHIFSDSNNPFDLSKLLELDRVELKKSKSDIEDMLTLSKSKIIVGSKNSTFSHWASFLEEKPTIWDEGCHINKKKIQIYNNEIIVNQELKFNNNFINLCINS